VETNHEHWNPRKVLREQKLSQGQGLASCIPLHLAMSELESFFAIDFNFNISTLAKEHLLVVTRAPKKVL